MTRIIRRPAESVNADSLESLLSEVKDVEESPAEKDELGETLLPSPADPMAVARVLMEARWMTDGPGPLYALRWHRGAFHRWDGTAWPEESDATVNGQLYAATENAYYEGGKGVEPWQPTKHKIANLRDALAQGVIQISDRSEPPNRDRGRRCGVCRSVQRSDGLAPEPPAGRVSVVVWL